jgi:hypothetical protein
MTRFDPLREGAIFIDKNICLQLNLESICVCIKIIELEFLSR